MKQRRGSKASGFRKQCHDIVAAALSVASCVFYVSLNACSGLSEIRHIPRFLIEGEVEVLVDAST